MYTIVDQFLQSEYKESYNTWKAMSTNYYNVFSNNIQEEEKEQVDKYYEMEEFWSQFGPISSIILVISTLSCCSTVLCCFKKYTINLEAYENDPMCPGNKTIAYSTDESTEIEMN